MVHIKSHKSSYPQIYLKSFDLTNEPEDRRVLALITYFPFFRFNFEMPRNARLYPKFLEQFAQHKKRLEEQAKQISLPAIESSKEKKLKKKVKGQKRKVAKGSNDLQVSVTSDNQRSVKTKEIPAAKSPATVVHEDSNSNYSFSEFYVPPKEPEKADNLFKSPGDVESSPKAVVEAQPEPKSLVLNPFATNSAPLADFIPLSNVENVPVRIEREPEVVADARVLLTKDHFRHLSTEKGQNFLYELNGSLNVVTQFKWDNTGNSLIITGTPTNQSMCHAEVRNFLFRFDLEHYEKVMESSSQVPKTKSKIVNFLKVHLQNILVVNKLSTFNVKKTLDNMLAAEKILDHKKTLRCRKSLNIMFIGLAELGDGGQHVGALRKILFVLEKELEKGQLTINSALREEIISHMKPIFSTMDHGDYKKLFQQFSKVMKQRSGKRLLPNPVILS